MVQGCGLFGDSKKSNTKTKEPTKTTQAAKTTNKPQSNASTKPSIPPVIVETVEPKLEPKEISTKEAHENAIIINAPLNNIQQFFGPMQWVKRSNSYNLAAQSRRIFVYTNDLKKLIHIDLIDDFRNARLDKAQNNLMLSVELKEHKLARYVLSNLLTDPQIEVIKPIEVQSPFHWLSAQQIITWSAQSFQIINIKPDGTLEILYEGASTQLNDVYAHANTLFISQNNSLDLVDQTTHKKTASLSLGRPFQFLGLHNKSLLLGYFDNKDMLYGYQWVNLNETSSQISSLGETHIFESPLSQPVFDETSGFLLGKADSIKIFNTQTQQFLRGTFEDIQSLNTWDLSNNHYILSSNEALFTGQISLDPDAIEHKESIQKLIDKQKNTPLAQIGANKRFNDEYNLIQEHSLYFGSLKREAHLLSSNKLLLLERTQKSQWNAQSTSNLLDDGETILKPVTLNFSDFTHPILKTPIGFFVHSPSTFNVSFISIELNEFIETGINVPHLESWTAIDSEYGPILVTASKRDDKKAKTKYVVQLYLLESPTQFELVHTLKLKTEPLVFALNSESFIVWDGKTASLFDVESFFPSETVQNFLNTTTPDKTKPYTATETLDLSDGIQKAKLTAFRPYGNTGWVLAYSQSEQKPWLVSLSNFADSRPVTDFTLSLSQYWASSFHAEISVLITVSDTGFHFYNVKDLKNPTLHHHWPTQAEWSDISQDDPAICLALKDTNLYCGTPSLSF